MPGATLVAIVLCCMCGPALAHEIEVGPAAAATDVPERSNEWWSLRPLIRPSLPALTDADSSWARNQIDCFVLAKLREKGLSPAPEADRRTLIRRLSFDLLGLPPSPDEVEGFVADPDPLAYEKLVDRLLASPHLGERWARHWLDVVHYGESHGYDKDKPRPHAWPYRDYIIRAFNEDRPYGRFVREQVAGDVLYPSSSDGIVALGFLAAGPWDFIGHVELPESKIDGQVARHLDRDDMVANTLNTFCSVTVQCAQCHDHKFDPITQEDYYSLQAVFAALDRADRPYGDDAPTARRRATLTAQLRALERQQQSAGLAGLEPGVRRDLEAVRQELATLPPPQLVYAATVHHGSGAFAGTGPNGGRSRPIHILGRGDVTRPGREVGPGTLQAVHALQARFDLPADRPEGARRAALAEWLTEPANPLVWRSIVNRIWLYHFGRGIVDTPNDFGQMGQPPTHPELLDWLAIEFRDADAAAAQGHGSAQSLKRLHRLLVTSATYRQAAVGDPRGAAVDSGNLYYWHANRRRLEAEAIRDSTLFVSGLLHSRLYGPSFEDFVIEKPEHSPHYQYHLHDPEDPRTQRRTVYRFIIRSQQQPFLAALDCADPSMAVDKRTQTVTPLQALAMLNDRFMVVMARHLAERVTDAGALDAQISSAFRLALGRAPRTEEQQALASYARAHGMANTCRMILNLNEFVFVD